MKPVSLLFVIGMGAALVAGACGKKTPATVAPVANADSAAAAEKARADSAAAAQHEADSLAALGRNTEEVKSMVAAMIHFDYDKANIRSEDAGTLDQKVAILQANQELKIRGGGHCDE